MLLRLLEFLAAALLIAFFWTQILNPLIKGQQILPYFRYKRQLDRLDGAREDLTKIGLDKEARRISCKAEKKRKEAAETH